MASGGFQFTESFKEEQKKLFKIKKIIIVTIMILCWLGQSHFNSFLTPGVKPRLTRNSLVSLKQSSMLICAGSSLQFFELQK